MVAESEDETFGSFFDDGSRRAEDMPPADALLMSKVSVMGDGDVTAVFS